MNRNKLYFLLITACSAGYIWLAISYYRLGSGEIEPGVCLFKRITSFPCPSCGSTRSVLSLLKGDIWSALFWNPFGLILMLILVISPLWVLFDTLFKKASFFNFYTNTELLFRRKGVAIFAILLVLMNWIWNIYKGL
jgi:hypothetical protein